MCQLLGMNCNTPTDIVFSFEGFRRRAGLTDCHSDGFGIAFFEGRGGAFCGWGALLAHGGPPWRGRPTVGRWRRRQ